VDETGESLIRAATGHMNLSYRGYHRVLKLARTIADLAGREKIQAAHQRFVCRSGRCRLNAYLTKANIMVE
jgi:predicted ATPase with chaperone activity